MGLRSNSKFYCIKGAVYSDQTAHFGPFYPGTASATPAELNVSYAMPYFTKTVAGAASLLRAGRYAKWPGVYSPPQPARAQFTVGTFAAITNHATFTLDDGPNPAAVFEYIKSGSPSGSNIPITITGLTTAAEVAAATAAAINNYTNVTLADIKGGWYASVPANKSQDTVYLTQTGSGSTALANTAQRIGWTARTYGALGNNAIVVGAGSGITGATTFTGGTLGQSGVFAQFVLPGHRWAMTESTYAAVPKGD